MSSSFQNEIPKARVNLKLDLHTGGGQKKVELPLKLLVAGDFSNGQEERPLSERVKTDINKNNFNDVLADISPSVHLNVENTLERITAGRRCRRQCSNYLSGYSLPAQVITGAEV